MHRIAIPLAIAIAIALLAACASTSCTRLMSAIDKAWRPGGHPLGRQGKTGASTILRALMRLNMSFSPSLQAHFGTPNPPPQTAKQDVDAP